jgi:thiosulfate reductase cytochrome b subunit
MVYSADLLIPVLDLRAGDVRIPNANLSLYEAFHQFAGWVLIALLIAWITAVAKGDRSDR